MKETGNYVMYQTLGLLLKLFAQRRLSNELCYPLLKAHFRKKQKKKAAQRGQKPVEAN